MPWTIPRARCSLTRGDPEQALQTLASGPNDGELAPYARLVRARAHIALDQNALALKDLDGLRLPGAGAVEVTMARSRLLANQGDVVGTDAATKALLKKEAEALYLRALAREKKGQQLSAIEVYQEVWAQAKNGGWDTLAQESITRLGGSAPDVVSESGRALAQRRRVRLSKGYRNEEALALADALAADHPATTRAEKLAHARLIQKSRDYAGAAQACGAVLGKPAEAMGSADELYAYGLNYARQGDYDTAGVLYHRVVAQHPATATAVTASYKQAYMAQDRGDCEKALPLFATHREAYPKTKHLSEALWFEARCLWRQGDHEGASTAYDQLLAAVPNSSLAPGAAYWSARAKGLAGDKVGQDTALQQVVNRWPTNGWSYFATV
ncbi:MAG: tetratricopeptide repeat protein, partial [Rhodobacterales bacterium]|nr:tetratricopeptide repeat protein [Rhodobacterales bacterium]